MHLLAFLLFVRVFDLLDFYAMAILFHGSQPHIETTSLVTGYPLQL